MASLSNSQENAEKLNTERLAEVVLEALESALGCVEVYEAAILASAHETLRAEWQGYLARKQDHVARLRALCAGIGLDPYTLTAGRQIARHRTQGLVLAIEHARAALDPSASELVAAESVVDAEARDLQNWKLIDQAKDRASGEQRAALQRAYDSVMSEEHAHLYRSMGWVRELWIARLGLPAALPPS